MAGSARGVRLAPVPAGVRPLSDRAREGLFSSLGPAVAEAAVLDLYAGTGATGIEALSRGARSCTFVERAPAALAALRSNLERARVAERATVVRADVARFLRTVGGSTFDLILCDPPYDLPQAAVEADLGLLAGGWLPPGDWTIVLTRRAKSSTVVIPIDWRVARELRYGESHLRLIGPSVGPGRPRREEP